MKIVIFGLTMSSSWGNGHATLWRGLCRALCKHRHRVVFYERDVPYYAAARDGFEIPGVDLVLYPDWTSVAAHARMALADADVLIVTSYCPDGIAASELIGGRPISVFYDLDTPVTLGRLRRGEPVAYIGSRGLADFDLVLSYTGGTALDELRHRLGARRVAPLYGHVDPEVHYPAGPLDHYRADLSYLGTYAPDRQGALAALLVEPARRRPDRRFLIGGAQYPQDFPWSPNIYFVRHLPPSEHSAFFSSSRLTLNITRRDMAASGWCPSGRMFEATACGTAVLSDAWEGLDEFFAPGNEILIAKGTEDAIASIDLGDAELRHVAEAGRARTLARHTADHRAADLLSLLEAVPRSNQVCVSMEEA